MDATLLLLADGRFPTGGHAHSAGTEAAVGAGDITDLASLEAFVRARLSTTGYVDAAFAAATCARCASGGDVPWDALQAEYLARTGSPRLREVARTMGRQLLRGGRTAWPAGRYAELAAALGPSVLRPISMGVIAHAAGLSPEGAALCELHHLVGAVTTAAVRLLGLDPFAIAALSARLAPDLERLAAEAAEFAFADPAELPADVSLLHDVLAEHHAAWEVRLFAS